MSKPPILLSALCFACSTPTEPTGPAPISAPPEVSQELMPAPPPPPRPPVTVPTEPALYSFTGQATHQGVGLWCAFYPLGWSDDGRFAWATVHRSNDMNHRLLATWHVRDMGPGVAAGELYHGAEIFPDDATLSWAWSQRQEEVDALLDEHGIRAGGTVPLTLPATTPWGHLEARWELGDQPGWDRPARMELRWPDGRSQLLFEGSLPDLGGSPTQPSLFYAPSDRYAAVVQPLIAREPAEALMEVSYLVEGLKY